MRLVDDDEVFVLMQDHLIEWDAFFYASDMTQVAVVVNANMALVRALCCDGYAEFVFYIAIGHALQPCGAGNSGEAFN